MMWEFKKGRTLAHPASKNSRRKKNRGNTYGNAHHLASIKRKEIEAEVRRKYGEKHGDHPKFPAFVLALDCLTLNYGVSPLNLMRGVKPASPEAEAFILEESKKIYEEWLSGIKQ